MSGPGVDLAIVGAGPAGMAAAVEAAGLGLSCLVLDEQPAPGGQIWRGAERAAAAAAPGGRHAAGLEAVRAFRDSGAGYRPGTLVWHVEAEEGGHRLWTLCDDRVIGIAARRVLLCTGAQERPVPLPGWTLPGVMTVGALQILLKTAGMTAQGPTVLIGNGPLLYLTARQQIAAGGRIAAVLLTDAPGGLRRAVPHLPGFLRSGALAAGLGLLAGFAALRLPVIRGVSAVELVGEGHLSAVRYRTHRGRQGEIPAVLACLHEGVVPETSLPRVIGCAHRWDEGGQAFRPVLDGWGNTSVPGVQIAGDGGGIAGVEAAAPAGRLAVLEAACAVGRIGKTQRDARAAPLRRRLDRVLSGRPLVDALYAPRLALAEPGDAVLLCRCEEVTAGAMRAALATGVQGPNQLKAALRCGMGPCQGRFCGLAVSRLIAQARGAPMDEVGQFRLRPPVRPVPLRSFAALAEETP